MDGSWCVVEEGTFLGNLADATSGYGGGICIMNGGEPMIRNILFQENISSEEGGGAVYADAISFPSYIGCVFVGNIPAP